MYIYLTISHICAIFNPFITQYSTYFNDTTYILLLNTFASLGVPLAAHVDTN